MVKLEKSQKEFLMLLLENENPQSIQSIQDQLDISRRTVYYIVNKINDIFYELRMEPINNKRGHGYYLTADQKKVVDSILHSDRTLQNLSPDERVHYLICWMMYPKTNIHIENIMELFDISRNSVFNDLKDLKSEIEKYDVSLYFDIKNGYMINGQVFSKRALLLYYLKILLKKIHYKSIEFLDVSEVETFYSRLQQISLKMHNEYDDYNLLAIACLLNIVHYVDEKFDLSILELRDLEKTEELHMIDKYFQDLNVHERLYLTIHLLGSKAGSVIRLDDSQRDIQLFELALHLVDLFERQTSCDISEKNELVNSLYMHFKLSMYYYQLSIQISNTLLEDVKENYGNLYQMIKNLCESMDDEFPFILTDSEISYITMHFGGHLKQVQGKFYALIRVLIVCPSGISTSTLLKREVEDLYANVTVIAATAAENIAQYKENIDFIVSTIDLDTDIPWIKVNAILTKDDKSKIASMMSLNMQTYKLNKDNFSGLFSIIQKYVDPIQMKNLKRDVYDYFREGNLIVDVVEEKQLRLKDIMYRDHLIRIDKDIMWDEAIRLASVPLLKTNIITENYINEMIGLVRDYGPYIVIKNRIAIAHAKTEAGANALGTALLINKKNIQFEDDLNIHYLFVISSSNPKEHLQILKDISMLASDDIDLNALLDKNVDEIMELIKKMVNRT
ncbi:MULTISPECIES: transcription antiterminator [Erysipelotrichales]|uniref:BglG family transcription antiterminator n=1 Tax=Erysipelotrichales TaxID=526525 RepID=UPI001D09DA9A|nr:MULTISPECIES: PTS sugar transporter subunit IIA [Erysipelotrichales]MCB8641680.1 PTS sugar transporter subunit IIA [Holdemanella sp. DFI.5.55]MCG5650342.1 PTS sugar transporter subunit IIA [Holdemanella sp. DFI.5.21]